MTEILWLTPNKPTNLSTGRQRIADGLESRGYSVSVTANRKKALRETIREHPDILMTTTAAGGLVGPPTVLNGTKHIVDYVDPILQMYHSSDFLNARVATLLQHTAFRTADGICYVYPEESLRINRFDTPIQKTTLGVDYERFANPVQGLTTARSLLPKRCDDGFAVYLGGLEDIYNIPSLLVSAENHGFELVIAGDGEYRTLVETTAEQTPNVQYLGLVDHELIPGLLAQASVGICLVDDPCTVKVLEYAASGVPIVHLKGRAEPVLPNQGVVYTNTDSAVIAHAVETAHNMTDTTQLQNHAQEHDYSRVIDDYEQMIQRVL